MSRAGALSGWALSGWALSGWALSGWALSGWALSGWALSGWARRRAGGAQEPYRGGCDAGPGIVVSGWRYDSRLRAGHGLRGISFRQARARNYQARRHGPGGHEIFRIIPAVQAGTLPLFLSRGV